MFRKFDPSRAVLRNGRTSAVGSGLTPLEANVYNGRKLPIRQHVRRLKHQRNRRLLVELFALGHIYGEKAEEGVLETGPSLESISFGADPTGHL